MGLVHGSSQSGWMAAGSADVRTVVVDGRVVVEGGRHALGDVGRLLEDAITPLWEGG